jgi:glycosyltransferase involved in cell wall biosynthesis
MDDRKVDVSVLCLSYNQERYIARCLDGFVNQQTDFRYEVLVHDDCSTDGTLQVIMDYERRYPDIFTVVTEEENQYSRHVNIYEDILLPI